MGKKYKEYYENSLDNPENWDAFLAGDLVDQYTETYHDNGYSNDFIADFMNKRVNSQNNDISDISDMHTYNNDGYSDEYEYDYQDEPQDYSNSDEPEVSEGYSDDDEYDDDSDDDNEFLNIRMIDYKNIYELNRFVVDDGISPTNFQMNHRDTNPNQISYDPEMGGGYIKDILEYIVSCKHPTAMYTIDEFNGIDTFNSYVMYDKAMFNFFSVGNYVLAYVIDTASREDMLNYLTDKKGYNINELLTTLSEIAIDSSNTDTIFMVEDDEYLDMFYKSSWNAKNEFITLFEKYADYSATDSAIEINKVEHTQSYVRQVIEDIMGEPFFGYLDNEYSEDDTDDDDMDDDEDEYDEVVEEESTNDVVEDTTSDTETADYAKKESESDLDEDTTLYSSDMEFIDSPTINPVISSEKLKELKSSMEMSAPVVNKVPVQNTPTSVPEPNPIADDNMVFQVRRKTAKS